VTLGGGHLFEASHIEGMSDQWATVRWATAFSQAPLLFGGSVTTHGPDFVLLMRNASSHTAEGVRSAQDPVVHDPPPCCADCAAAAVLAECALGAVTACGCGRRRASMPKRSMPQRPSHC
jgi:hypothetical protein